MGIRFPTEIHTAEIPQQVEQMLRITGEQPLIKRLEWLDRELAENPYMEGWLADRFVLEFAFQRWLAQDDLSAIDQALRDKSTYELMAFVTGITSIYPQLSAKAQNRLRGQLSDGLKSDTGLLPLQLEVSAITHLMRAGYSVEANDLEAGGGFDFLAKKDG